MNVFGENPTAQHLDETSKEQGPWIFGELPRQRSPVGRRSTHPLRSVEETVIRLPEGRRPEQKTPKATLKVKQPPRDV